MSKLLMTLKAVYRLVDVTTLPIGVVAPLNNSKRGIQMKREELVELGLEKETINAVMALHGTTVNNLKDEKRTLETEKEQLTQQVEQYSSELDDLKNNSSDSDLKEQINQLQANNQELKDSQANELSELKRQHKIELAVKGLGVSDEEYITAKLSDLELDEDGKLKEFDNRVNELKEKHPLLFEGNSQEPVTPKKWSQGNATVMNGKLSREEIMNEPDRHKRQELIDQNQHLFN